MAPSGAIRAATQHDVPAVAALHVQHLLYHVRFDERYLPRDEVDYEAVYRDHLRQRDTAVWIATADSAVVGFALSRMRDLPPSGWLQRLLQSPPSNPPSGHLVDFFVQEGHRCQGYGSALLERSFEWLRERGATEVSLGVMVDNELGRRFWTNQGFVPYRLQMRRSL